MVVRSITFLKSWSIHWLFLLKIIQEVDLCVDWKQNEEKDISEVHCI